jgi:phenylacetate-CoA ligase
MFETGVRQFRLALGMVQGRRLDPRNVARLVDDMLATLAEFGEPGADVAELIDGPMASPEARLEVANRSLRRTALRLAAQSPFYARHFSSAHADPAKLDVAGLRTIPVTTRADLIERPGDFRCTDVPVYLATRTTGTTGRPAEVWLSRYEMELWPALGALASVLRDELRPGDVMQVNLSSRSTAALHLSAAGCRLVGAGWRPLGIVPPEASLDSLAEGGATILLTCPSYLAELVTAAQRRGMSVGDFQLRRLVVGGEVLSTSPVPARRTAALRAGRHSRDQPHPRQGRPVAAPARRRGRHAPSAHRGDRGTACRALARAVPCHRLRRPDPAHPAGRRDRWLRRGRGCTPLRGRRAGH